MLKWINKKRNQKGFTLIELIVVIAILAILAVIAIPRLTGSRDKANRSAVLASLRSIESAISVAEAEGDVKISDYENEVAKYEGNLQKLVTGNYLAKLPSGPKSTKYGVNENGRAVVFFDGDTFQFTKKDTDDKYVLISGTGPFLLDDLSEEKETKVD